MKLTFEPALNGVAMFVTTDGITSVRIEPRFTLTIPDDAQGVEIAIEWALGEKFARLIRQWRDDDTRDMSGRDKTPEDQDEPSGVIALNMTTRRRQLGMSQTELADAMQAAGLTHWRQNTVSRVETGKQELKVREVRALEGILGSVTVGTDPTKDTP